MPELDVDVLTEGAVSATVTPGSRLAIEVELDTVVTTGIVGQVEVAEVVIPDKIEIQDTVHNYGGAPGLIVLEASDMEPPPDTPAGTIVFQKV